MCPLCLATERSLVMVETESEVWRAEKETGWGEAEGRLYEPLLRMLPHLANPGHVTSQARGPQLSQDGETEPH